MNNPIMKTPTELQYHNFQLLFDYFNTNLFEGRLPVCFLIFSRRQAQIGGHFSHSRWSNKGGQTLHEININPVWMANVDDETLCSVIVHEMCHLEQSEVQGPPTSGYHNKEWGDLMKRVGLMPSDTGAPGGKQVGFRMSHYIIKGGKFEEAMKSLPPNILLPFRSFENVKDKDKNKRKKLKVAYECPSCHTKVWGKPNLNPICSKCFKLMKSNDENEQNSKLGAGLDIKLETSKLINIFLKTIYSSQEQPKNIPIQFVEKLIQTTEEEILQGEDSFEISLYGMGQLIDEWRAKRELSQI